MNTKVPVVVVYQGGNGSLAIARTLGRLGIPTYLVAKKEVSPVSSSRYWAKKFWWDFAAPLEESLQFLLDVARRIGTRPILLTTADWVAIFIEQHADALKDAFIFTRPSAPVIRTLTNKWEMCLLAKEHGIPTPETVYPECRDDVLQFLENARFPVVVKRCDSFSPQNTPNEIVYTAHDLLEKYNQASIAGPANVVFQEYIPGTAESVWMCNAYFAAGSECRAIFSGRKLRQVSPTGAASLAVCLPNEAVETATRRFMQGVGYEGPVGIGYRYDAQDGLYKVLDVNARVSGVFRLFRATNGMDIVRICYRDLTGDSIPESVIPAGRKWMLEDDFLSALRAVRERKLTLRQWLMSLRGVRETGYFAADDPVPMLLWLREHVRNLISKVRRRMSPSFSAFQRALKA